MLRDVPGVDLEAVIPFRHTRAGGYPGVVSEDLGENCDFSRVQRLPSRRRPTMLRTGSDVDLGTVTPFRHTRAGGYPEAVSVGVYGPRWIPACAGMTGRMTRRGGDALIVVVAEDLGENCDFSRLQPLPSRRRPTMLRTGSDVDLKAVLPFRHTRAGGYPEAVNEGVYGPRWIPACAGMTVRGARVTAQCGDASVWAGRFPTGGGVSDIGGGMSS